MVESHWRATSLLRLLAPSSIPHSIHCSLPWQVLMQVFCNIHLNILSCNTSSASNLFMITRLIPLYTQNFIPILSTFCIPQSAPAIFLPDINSYIPTHTSQRTRHNESKEKENKVKEMRWTLHTPILATLICARNLWRQRSTSIPVDDDRFILI
jgi:hypothetical protein